MPKMDGFMFAERVKRERRFAATPLVMLTSATRPGDAERCRTVGIAAHLTKPVKQSDLLDAIQSLVVRHVVPDVPSRRLPRSARRALHVLLAEDNEVNRRFVTRVLEKRGHSISTATTGREAIDAIARYAPRQFDVVLMDVQMPELDGLSATVLIRQRERAAGDGHVPIVAMTAHAMTGDRERCLAAGMDDYVSKPIRPDEIVEAVERASDRDRDGRPARKPASPTADETVFDARRAGNRLHGDRRLLRELVTIFRAESPALMAAIRKAHARGNTDALRQAAHALKGALGTLDAPRAFAAANQLEDTARRGDRAGIESAVDGLEREMIALRQALVSFRKRAASRRKASTHAATRPRRHHPRRR
jgi:CheY-like chemotaxis protein/HPt (histidine-containing phosphotransfer) domain-containing protein